jgi:Carboxypeptidase regulatory-like domain
VQRRWLILLALVGAAIAFVLLRRDDPRAPQAKSTETVVTSMRDAPVTKQTARTIAGVVLFEGKPAAGATVRVRNSLALAETSVVTGADGKFALGAQRATVFELIAEKAKLTPAIVKVDLRDPRARPEALELVLQPCTAVIHGAIRDAVGGAVPRARLAVIETAIPTAGGTEADDAGAYEMCVAFGDSTIVVGAAGYAKTIETVEAYGRVRRDFALVPEAQLAGRVLRASDRTPVANALVEARPESVSGSAMTGAITLRGFTDDSGNFTIEGALPGTYAIVAAAEGIASLRPIYAVAETGENADPIIVLVGQTRVVAGIVTEHDSKTPVPGVTVWLQVPTTYDAAPPLRASAITQADGTYALEVVPDVYVVTVIERPLSNPPSRVTVTTSDVKLDLAVMRAGSVSGRITRQGKPVGEALVTVRGMLDRETKTASDGTYTVRDLIEGEYDVYAESERAGAFAASERFRLAEGEVRKGADVELALSASIAGIVVDQHDVPISDAAVSFARGDDQDFGNATTAGDGTFEARALAGGGDYAARVLLHQRSVELPPVGDAHPLVTVRDGGTRVSGVRIKVHRELLAITGRVVDARDRPVVGARLELDPEIYIPPTMTDETGAFALHDLPSTTYTLSASYGGREARVEGVRAGSKNITIKFADSGSIAGTLDGFTEPPEVTVAVEGGFSYHATVTDKSFQITKLPVGSYRVSASSLGGIDVKRVDVKAGALATVALRARGLGAITGTVTFAETDQAVPNVECSAVLLEHGRMELRSAVKTTADGRGFYRLERVAAGTHRVTCGRAFGLALVVEGGTAKLDVVVKPPQPRGDPGFTLAPRRDRLVVATVAPSGGAARAGMAVGDVIVEMFEGPVDPDNGPTVYDMLKLLPAGKHVLIGVERGGTRHVLDVVLAAP